MKSLTRFRIQLITIVLGQLFLLQSALARPQYAVRSNTVSCNLCHVSPVGGGPRTVYGKIYGSRNMGMGLQSSNELFQGDLRALAFFPTEDTVNSRNGFGLMSTIVSANIPITKSEKGSELRGVATYDFGGFAPGLRDAYAQWRFEAPPAFVPDRVIVGKFNAPFGLLTDEHRTYVRLQTPTSFNDHEFGFMASGDPHHSLHYDLALTNGFQSAGVFTSSDLTLAVTANARWRPFNLPAYFGVSANYHNTTTQTQSPWAISFYGALSLEGVTQSFVKGSLTAEASFAEGWNQSVYNSGVSTFVSSAASVTYLNAIQSSSSLGFYTRLEVDLLRWLTLVYKLDAYVPDQKFIADLYTKHGVGLNVTPLPNLNLIARYEKAFVGRPGIEATNVSSGIDVFYLLVHFWL